MRKELPQNLQFTQWPIEAGPTRNSFSQAGHVIRTCLDIRGMLGPCRIAWGRCSARGSPVGRYYHARGFRGPDLGLSGLRPTPPGEGAGPSSRNGASWVVLGPCSQIGGDLVYEIT